jgi:hypothetical protein
VLRGEITPSIAVALTGLANAALRAFEMNLGLRLAQLEELMASRARPVAGRLLA